MTKKRVRALNADGDITWCSAEVMGAKGCNHLAHGTETEVEAAQVEFFMGDSGVSAVITSDSSALPTSSNEAQDLQFFKEKQRLDDLLAKKGFTEEHLRFLADPNSQYALMDTDYHLWMKKDLAYEGDGVLSEREKDILLTKLPQEDYDLVGNIIMDITNPKAIEKIFNNSDAYAHFMVRSFVSSRLVRNPNTPPHILSEISKMDITYEQDSDKNGRMHNHMVRYFAQNPNSPEDVLKLCAEFLKLHYKNDDDKNLCGKIIGHPNFPQESIDEIISPTGRIENGRYIDPNKAKGFRPELAKSKYLSPENIVKLYGENEEEHHPYTAVTQNLAENPNTPPEVLSAIFNKGASYFRAAALKNPNFSKAILANIVRNPDKYDHNARAAVAKNPNTPEASLIALCEDREYRKLVVHNRGASPALLESLSKDVRDEVRWGVAAHPNTPPAILDKLASSVSPKVRGSVIKNTKTSSATLEKLFDASEEGRTTLMYDFVGNPNATPKMLENMFENASTRIAKFYEERYYTYSKKDIELEQKRFLSYIASHPNAPVSLLEKLAKIPDRTKAAPVQNALMRNDNFPVAKINDFLKRKTLKDDALATTYIRLLS